MNVSSITAGENSSLRRNLFIKYSNSFMSAAGGAEEAIEKAQKANPLPNSNKID